MAEATGGTEDPGDRGRLVIADKVVQKVARRVASEVPAVAVTHGRIPLPLRAQGLPKVEVTIAGGRARIAIELATVWPHPAATVAALVRDDVRARVSELVGLSIDAVDVVVAEVVHVAAARRRVL